MIGILVLRREQTENEVVQQTDTAARLAFADHMNRFRSQRSYAKLPGTNENVGLRAPGV
jgi:hypothetical protein